MLNALYVSALGMGVQKSQLDVVSNNLANTNTAGFKREKVDFSRVMEQQSVTSAMGEPSAQPQRLTRDLSQGELRSTGRALDVAINGAGFLEVQLAEGAIGYVRGGALRINADGYLTTESGRPLASDIRIPANASSLNISEAGVVTAVLGSDAAPTELGRLTVTAFANSDLLRYQGEGVFLADSGIEPSSRGAAQEEGRGAIVAGKLEMSNVKLVDEMVSLMMAQRVYELNSKVVQAADELMAMTNSLRRG